MSQKDCEGNKRAAEFNDALLNVPGYADDTLLFIVRYGSLVKVRRTKPPFSNTLTYTPRLQRHSFIHSILLYPFYFRRYNENGKYNENQSVINT